MTGIRRFAAAPLLVPLAALLVFGTLVADAPAIRSPVAQPDTRPVAVVSLGDSTLAGEGAGDYLPSAMGYQHITHCLSDFLRTDVREAACQAGPDGLPHPVGLPPTS